MFVRRGERASKAETRSALARVIDAVIAGAAARRRGIEGLSRSLLPRARAAITTKTLRREPRDTTSTKRHRRREHDATTIHRIAACTDRAFGTRRDATEGSSAKNF
jgi:hypothetical protein